MNSQTIKKPTTLPPLVQERRNIYIISSSHCCCSQTSASSFKQNLHRATEKFSAEGTSGGL